MNEGIDIAVTGLSGQGVIMYVKMLANSCLAARRDVRTYEVLGTAHRGTLVMTHIRIGNDESTFSNLIPPGSADLVVSLEPLEGLRIAAYYLADGGQVLLNTHKIIPTYASLGKDFYSKKPRKRGYPPVEEIVADLKTFASRVVPVPATDIAKKAGHFALSNVAMLGATAATGLLPITTNQLLETIKQLAPKGTTERNIEAFHMGSRAYEEALSLATAS